MGKLVGLREGLDVGKEVGKGVGEAVGLGVGPGVGFGVGRCVGNDVGSSVGSGVGLGVGLGLGACALVGVFDKRATKMRRRSLKNEERCPPLDERYSIVIFSLKKDGRKVPVLPYRGSRRLQQSKKLTVFVV